MIIRFLNIFILGSFCLFFSSCFGPRNIFLSGKVTPKGCFTVGANLTANISTSGASQAYKTVRSASSNYNNRDSTFMDEQLNNISKTAIAYSIDPVSAGYDFYLRYGFINRFDIGYRYNNGAHVIDTRFQFLGTTGNFKNNNEDAQKKLWHGSMGVQYSAQSTGIPFDYFGLIGQQFNFSLSRKDLLFPITLSYAFGPEEKYGAICFGILIAQTRLKYSFSPQGIYQLNQGVPKLIPAFNEDKSFISGGAFAHIKFGYKFIYGVIGSALYYQNFGSFNSLNQSSFSFKGFTLVPNAGIVITSPSVFKRK